MENNQYELKRFVDIFDLEEVNKEIAKIKNRESVRASQKKNPKKVKEQRDSWNKKYRNEYQRAYRAKKRTN